jgi:CDP-Glycerol:Poly(glycerophosphate) glycerophosphotransferase
MNNRLVSAIVNHPLNIFMIIFLNLKMIFLKCTGKKTIVYNIQMDYFYNTFEPVYKVLSKDKRIVVYFACFEGMQKVKDHLRDFIPAKFLISSQISPFIYFDMFITAEINGPDFPVSFLPTHKIQIYHGIGVAALQKKINVLSRFNTHFALGPQLVEFFETLPQNKRKQNEHAIIGFPKLDAISHPDPQQIEELKKLYNIKDQFVILYAPHWNPDGSLHKLSLDMIARLTKFENVIILIKVHNFLYTRFKDANWKEKLQKFADSYANVVYVTRPNTQDIFPLGDMMITDAITTTAFEFSLTYKPVFAYDSPVWFKDNPHNEVESEILNTAICFSDADEIYDYTHKLLTADKELLAQIEIQKRKQKQLIDKYLYNPGEATPAALKVIYQELHIKEKTGFRNYYNNRLLRIISSHPLDIFKIFMWNLRLMFVKLTGKKTIVFNIQTDYFYNIFEPVYLALKKNKKIQIFFAVLENRQNLICYLKDYSPSKFIISGNISPFVYFDMFITAEINGPNFPASFLSTKKIQMYHGTGVYPLYQKTEVLSRFNLHFAIGPQFVEFIKTLPHTKKNENKCAEVGFPKLDAVFSPNPNFIKKLKNMYHIKDQFVILYTPHWNPYGSLHVLSLEMIAKLAQLDDVVILIKVHHFLFTKYKEQNWRTTLQDFADEHDNVVFVTRANTQEIYPLGDMLITDTGTTAAFEFSITQKPVFVFSNQDWFNNNQFVEVEEQINDMAINFTDTAEIVEYAKKLTSHDVELDRKIAQQKVKQQSLIEKYLFNPQMATRTAVQVIEKELGISQ